MLVFILISLLYCKGNCHVIPIPGPTYSKELIKCVTNIVSDYFAPQKVLTYIGNDNEFLQAIHQLNTVTTRSRFTLSKLPVLHEGYLITANNYALFVKRFPILLKESTWNPKARFLIVIKSLEIEDLQHMFNIFLKQHVNNVIVVNATADAHLYTYNPFDNFGCGKRYDDIISYGKCSQAHAQNLYPDKLVTKLRNCTFTVAIPNWPPYTIFPVMDNGNNNNTSRYLYGIEPYLLRLVGEMKGFTLNVVLDKEFSMSYSTVSSDMEAVGSLNLLQNNKADIILGGLILVPSRAVAFSYVYDLFPYVDEIQFVVRRASLVPSWKYIYLEFNGIVWVLIVLSLALYSMIMIILLHGEDKSLIVLKLLDSLLLHGCKIQCQSTVKAIFIIWLWFAYLTNAFYQSSLFSLTTHPPKENQISTEEDIVNHKLKPCFSTEMDNYYMESVETRFAEDSTPGCHTATESITKVMNSGEYFTIYLQGIIEYNSHNFMDNYGNSLIYTLEEPYSKIIYSMYFYKGFPLIHDIRVDALRLREMGLVSKAMSDMNYLKTIKHNYSAKSYEPRFVIPWLVYITGCVVAVITLAVEKISIHKL